MTAVDERGMTRFFETFEPPEGVKAELLRGEIVMMASPDLVHNVIVMLLGRQVPVDHWYALQTQDVDIVSEASEPVPDLVVVAPETLPASGRLLPSTLITMVVEVVSKTSIDRDYGVKRSIYAAGGVPVYLVVDPVMAQCVVLTEPEGVGEKADYKGQAIWKFGETVPVSALRLDIDTSGFSTFPNVRPHRYP
ncbi:Uma2 family endonuclease [Streptomyces phaeolivaceus]|uniref:Uma2 family endonuclease n=1 Tax=Streptomyces phaeolivaceus TaxID=2653200 RepID=A0A5P8K2Y1_9ACTN|nr:Uma2 family endonuclease [Streptomyces phaeolivaceus]QFQ97128.1 Uma2 family endonuclease [Streptomyces phaeolivaceus]